MPRRRLLVFLKAPRPGTVKTRLAATLGDDDALAAYRELVTLTLANLDVLPTPAHPGTAPEGSGRFVGSPGFSRPLHGARPEPPEGRTPSGGSARMRPPAPAEVELRFTPDDAAAEIASWLRCGWGSSPQGDGDLGARLARAFAEAFADGCERVAVIGTDCPYFQADDFADMWDALEESDVVLGPATDGGYWLLALRAPQPELFADIAWSTPAVLKQTQAKARAAGLAVHLLRELSDVDTEANWRQFDGQRRKEPAG